MTAAVSELEYRPFVVQLRHALVWDRDREVAAKVAHALRRHGHDVHAVTTGDAVETCLDGHQPELMIVGCSQAQDLRCVRRLRAVFSGPLLCYSATAGARDRIELLAAGVDDVVPSPLSYEELALRVQAVARRSDLTDPEQLDELTCGPVRADGGTHQVHLRGEWVQLTAVEFSLLAFLMRNPRVAFTRRDLLRNVWGYEIGDTSTVSVHIRRLRRKLEQDATRPEMIRTVWGSGYYFDPSAD
ncbi:MAG TPA: response regulator transcription factor [Euzebyales bacterium]|nr:response regulator transcription factor [Euzebyales bacterium]